MSNSANGYMPLPPPPAPNNEELEVAVIAIAAILGASVLLCGAMCFYIHVCRPSIEQAKAEEEAHSALMQSKQGTVKGLGAVTPSQPSMAAINEDEEQDDSKELSPEDIQISQAIQQAWSEPPRTEEPPAPEPERKAPETMDEKLKRIAAARIQAQIKGKQAREMRARYLKGGGRPNAADFQHWREAEKQSSSDLVPVRLSEMSKSMAEC